MKHIKHLLFLLLLLTGFTCGKAFAQGTEHAPVFVYGHNQALIVCENDPAHAINRWLAVLDSDAGDTETWTVINNAPNGTLVAAYTTTSTGDTLNPTGLSYTPNTGFSGMDSFTVSVSDGSETDTTTVHVTVNPLPVVPAITGIAGACIGDTSRLSDTPAGGTWSSGSTGVATINSTSGLATGLSAGTAIMSYSVTNGCGTTVATLPFTVNTAAPPMPPGITGLHAVCAGLQITLNNTAPGGQWSSSTTSIAIVDPVLGKVTGVAAGLAAITYSETNFCASYFTFIIVTVDAVPTAIIGATNLCTGTPVPLSDAITGGMWSSSASTIATVGSVTGNITGITTGTAALTYIVGAASCKISTIVTVNLSPTAFVMTGGGPYCAGSAGAHIGLAGSEAGISYQLYLGSTAVGSAVAGTGGTLDFGPQPTVGLYTVTGTNTITGCSKTMTGILGITINPLPMIYSMSGGGNYCTGGTGYHIYLVGSQSGMTYQLYNGTTASGAPMPGTGGALDYGIHTAAGVYTVVATNPATGCTRTMAGSATITIHPTPALFGVIGGGNYCAGGTGVHIGLDSSGLGVNYQLYSGGMAYGLPVAGTGIPLDLGLVLPAGSYTVVATSIAGCVATMPGSTSVVINPLPTAYTVTAGGGYCLGGTGSVISLSNSTTGVSYQLYTGGSAAGTAQAGTDTTISFDPQTTPGTYTVVATNTTTLCSSVMTGSAPIFVDSLPFAYAVTGGGGYCAGGDGVTIDLAGSEIDVDYQLYYGGAASGIPETGSGGALDLGLETGAGIYTIIATNAFTGCTNHMAGSATVVINPMPAAITGIDSVIAGLTTTLSDATAGGTWSSENTAIATVGATGIVAGIIIGTDTIAYTLSTGCAAKVEVSVNYLPVDTTKLSVAQIRSNAGDITLFPNPTPGTLNIKWENQATGTADIMITDVTGRAVYRTTININDASGQTPMGLDLKDGIYLVTIKSETIYYTGKLQVQR